MEKIIAKSFAKLNLFLEIRRRRDDGFHEIESVFQEIDLADDLHFCLRDDGALNLKCDVPEIPTGGSNLIIRAAQYLQAETGCKKGADILLSKRIPVGGGLGGGSSNAAATLIALNFLWETELPPEKLKALASALGSDVCFFLHGGACLCRGRGEIVEPLESSAVMEAVLVIPEWGISSAEAYQALTPADFGQCSAGKLVEAIKENNHSSMGKAFFNRFEKAVFRLEPRQGQLFEKLNTLGFSALRMSGSGSTFFGLVPEGSDPAEIIKATENCDGVSQAILVKNAPQRLG